MSTFSQDLKYALRLLTRKPGFTAAAVLTLAVGIGANTAVFSFMNALFLRPLPGNDSERIVRVYSANQNGSRFNTFAYPNYTDLRDRSRSFSDFAVHQYATAGVNTGGDNEEVEGEVVAGNYFSVMGVPAAMGRVLTPEDDQEVGAHPVVVIGDGLWKRMFGADPQVVGRDLTVNGNRFTVIGVAPEWFRGSYESLPADFWAPIMMYEQVRPRGIPIETRGWGWLDGSARLAPGVTREQAQSELTDLSARLEEENPRMNAGTSFEVFTASPLPEGLKDGMSGVLTFLMVVVSLVLLATCANIAGILLVRATTRTKETAIRLAMGANRGRLIRQWLSESIVLSALGGVVALVLAMWLSELMLLLTPPEIGNFVPDLSLDFRVLTFTFAATLLTGILFGLFPALRASRPDLVSRLKDDAASSGFMRRSRLHGAFVVGQVAVSLVVLILAGLLLRSLDEAARFDPGFDSDRVLVSSVNLRRVGYLPDAARGFHVQLLDRLTASSDVEAATISSSPPLSGGADSTRVNFADHEPPEGQVGHRVGVNSVVPGYFKTMGIAFKSGRDFDWRETEGEVPSVVVINETIARRFWEGRDPVGDTVTMAGGGPTATVVGVVADSNYYNLGEDPLPHLYLPFVEPLPLAATVLVRARGEVGSLAPLVRREVEALDPNVVLSNVATYDQLKQQPLFANRAMAMVSTSFGVLALVLAAVGIYGIVAYSVHRRTHEIGVRMALGASRSTIFRIFLGQGMLYTGLGVVIGLGGAFASTRLIGSLLFGVGSTDAVTFVGISSLFVLVSLMAVYLPAYRAMRVDPMSSLRHE